MPPKSNSTYTLQCVSGNNKNSVLKAGKGSTSTIANTTEGRITDSTTPSSEVDSLLFASHGNFPKPV